MTRPSTPLRAGTWRRRITSQIAVALCGLSVIVALIPLGFILFFVLSKGVQALNWDFFTKMPVPVGETGGGMANAIVGTLMLSGLGALLAIPIGTLIAAGIYVALGGLSRAGGVMIDKSVGPVFAYHPAFKVATVESCSPGTVHLHVLGNAFLHAGNGHDDLEDRTRS